MSRLLIITRPEIASGFHLAGVDAYAAANALLAESQIKKWLAAGEQGLLAVDEELFDGFAESFRNQLLKNDQLPLLVLPSGNPVGTSVTSQRRLAELIRQAVGFHITFQDK